ncbi:MULTISPECIES: YCF48-related protein [unclassified Neptuniibacter]|uniref:WD40/YVTN/BNR-like repeat-containing protein n=1 Tax=unclassified Neptuniibacter TaxID=2630693 RepID=UPI000C3DBB53|nr:MULTISPECIES: YCF48-related protein [unclassified Neptuniibacter]MAY40941.1 photosystem I reaction center subunit IV [Oceanospirillaceae bacterium]
MQRIGSSFLILLTLLLLTPWAKAERLEQIALQQSSPSTALLLTIEQAGDRLVAAGEQGIVIFSNDDGAIWQQANVPASVLITGLHFFDNQKGWAVGHDGIVLATTDGGANWTRQLDGVVINQLRVGAIKEEIARFNELTVKDELALEELEFLLDDAELASEEGPSTPLLDLLFLDSQHGYALGAYGLFLETRDGGNSWAYIGHKLPNPDGFHLNKIFQTREGTLIIIGEAGLMLSSVDLGNTWSRINVPYEGSLFSIAEADELYVMGLRGTLLQVLSGEYLLGSDGSPAVGWRTIQLDITSTINDSALVDGQLYLVGQDGVLLRQNGKRFEPFSKRGLRSYSAITSSGSYLVLVGEGGVSRIALNEGGK